MARNTQQFETVVTLNAQQAQNQLAKMEENLKKLRKDKAELLSGKSYKPEDLRELNKEIRQAEGLMGTYRGSITQTIKTLSDLDNASLGEIQTAVRNLKKEMRNVTSEDEYARMDALLQKANARIIQLKSEAGETAQEMRRLAEAGQTTASVLANIENASLYDLKTAAATLNEEMLKAKPASSAYVHAEENLHKVNDRIRSLTEGQRLAAKTLEQYNSEANKITKTQKQIDAENHIIENTIKNLSHSSLRDLEASLKMVKEQMGQFKDRGDAGFKELAEKARKLDSEIKKVNESISGKTGNVFGRWWQRLNNNWGAMTQAWGAFTGLTDTVRQTTAAFAEMDQEMVNVQKYTGQTKEEVVAMNEDFKRMNTRTAREELNQLAGSAGRLGITATSDIEEFVDAADKINVALGDDLGEKAVDQIGKLAMMFGEDKKKGLRGAMLSTGSAINELAQSSSASAGYLVDFTARLSGVGKQAGLTQQQIMGFASVLDQNMQQDETAATAMQNLITKMFQQPAKFAALAGKSVKEFTNLLKNDANEALIQFFGAMRKNGGFAQLAPMFDEMKMDGSRAVGVLSVIADKLADVKVAQETANRAYASGQSVIDEFNTQMSSQQAALDMAKKNFKELTIELGEQLLPVVKYTISTGALLVKTLLTLINFTRQHYKGIIALAAAITTVASIYYMTTIKAKLFTASMIVQKNIVKGLVFVENAHKVVVLALQMAYFKLTGQTAKCKAAMDALRAASIANPYAILAAALLALVAVAYKLYGALVSSKKAIEDNMLSVRKAKAVHKDMVDATREMNENTAEERTRVEQLTKIIDSNVYSYNEKKAAMIALEKIVPGYHRNLKNEATLTRSNNKALAEYVTRLNDAAMAQALYNRMIELQGKKFDLEVEIRKHKVSAKAVQAEIARHPDIWNATETGAFYRGGMNGYVSLVPNMPTEANRRKHAELKQWVDLIDKASSKLVVINHEIQYIDDYMVKNAGVREYYAKLASEGTGGGNGSSGVVIPRWDRGFSSPGHYKDPKQVEKERKKAESEKEKAKRLAEKNEREMSKQRKQAYQEAIKEARGNTDKEQAMNILAYSKGEKTFTQYLDDQHSIAIEGYRKLEAIYKQYGTDYGQWQDEIAKEELKKNEDHQKALLSDIEKGRVDRENKAKEAYETLGSSIYHDEKALNELLFQNDMRALSQRLEAMEKGTQEWLDTRSEMEQRDQEHRIYLHQYYAELLSHYQEQWGKADLKEQERIAMKGIEELYDKRLIKWQEYQEARAAIALQYRKEQSEQDVDHSDGMWFHQRSEDAYQTASNNANADYQNEHPFGMGVKDWATADVKIYASTLANLKKMEQEGVITHEEAMAAMGRATAEMAAGIASKMQAAYDAVSPIMDAMSSYYSAQSDYEVTVTEKKYEKLINAAGNNQAKAKKLEEKKEKEIAAIKTKYARKQSKMQVAQAIAQTAISAISAYSSAMAGVPYPANLVLAPIAAGLALAAGAIQIATIKKQQQAQEAGYYEGGFTGGRSYRRRAGVVHEGEFVANHAAVNNPQLLPALRLIDMAQRNNTVGSLTALDLSRSMGVGATTVVSAPVVNVATNNAELATALREARDTIERLGALLDGGIAANVSMEEFKKKERHWNSIHSNR